MRPRFSTTASNCARINSPSARADLNSALFRRRRPRRVELPDREFAPPQRAAFVAIHPGEFSARVGEDESEFLRPLRFHLNGFTQVLRKREALLDVCTGLGELPDPGMEALPRTKV